MPNILFILISVIILAACWRVVTTRNLFHSVLSAFIVLVSTAAIYFMLDAEFLGIAQILIYAGAVTILILFVVMLTTAGPPKYEIISEKSKNWLLRIFVLLFFAMLAYVIMNIQWPTATTAGFQLKSVTNTLAEKIFLEYLLPFEVASVLLLAALIGAVVLARKE